MSEKKIARAEKDIAEAHKAIAVTQPMVDAVEGQLRALIAKGDLAAAADLRAGLDDMMLQILPPRLWRSGETARRPYVSAFAALSSSALSRKRRSAPGRGLLRNCLYGGGRHGEVFCEISAAEISPSGRRPAGLLPGVDVRRRAERMDCCDIPASFRCRRASDGESPGDAPAPASGGPSRTGSGFPVSRAGRESAPPPPSLPPPSVHLPVRPLAGSGQSLGRADNCKCFARLHRGFVPPVRWYPQLPEALWRVPRRW